MKAEITGVNVIKRFGIILNVINFKEKVNGDKLYEYASQFKSYDFCNEKKSKLCVAEFTFQSHLFMN